MVVPVVASVLLVQCSNEDPNSALETPERSPTPVVTDSPKPSPTPFTSPTSVPPPTEVLPPDNLERGGIFRLAIPEGAPHLDRHLTVSSSLVSWGSGLAYSRILKFDSGPDTSFVVCDLCESWTQTTPLSFEFKLRDDVWIGGNFDIAIGAPAPIHSISGYLLNIHHSQGAWNTSRASDPELDRLIEAQAAEYHPGKRSEMLKEIQERIIAAKYRMILATRNTHWAYWNTVEGWEPYITRGDTDFLTRMWKSSG